MTTLALFMNRLQTKADPLSDKEEASTNTFSEQTLDHLYRIGKIEANGNKPEEWLTYILFVQKFGCFKMEERRRRFLYTIYEKALEEIPIELQKEGDCFATLVANYVKLKSLECYEAAKFLVSEFRHSLRRFAIIHIVAAQLELSQGDKSKCRRILHKAKDYQAQPAELLTKVCRNFSSGQTELLTDSDVYYPFNVQFKENWDELSAKLSHSQSFKLSDDTFAQKKSVLQETYSNNVNERLSNSDITSDDVDKALSGSNSFLFKAPAVLGQHSYYSTPDCKSVESSHSKSSYSLRRRGALSNIGLPRRVPCSTLAESDDEEEVKPKKIVQMNRACLPSTLEISAESSGYEGSSHISLSNHIITNETFHSAPLTYSQLSSTQKMDYSVDAEGSLDLSHKSSVNEIVETSADEAKIKNISAQMPVESKHLDPVIQSGSRPLSISTPSSFLQEMQKISTSISVMTSSNEIANKGIPSQRQLHTTSKAYTSGGSFEDQPQGQVIYSQTNNLSSNGPFVSNQQTYVVNGKQYLVLKKVGRGGSSEVYMVYDLENKRTLAIKHVNLNDADEMVIEGYKNEIILLQRLQYSDKVIKLFDYEYNISKNCLYVVMENGDIDLATLFRNRIKQGEISEEMRKFYWSEMLQAVAVIHKQGIIHSDLKPANFLLVAGNLKLIDFGIANAIQSDNTSIIKDTQVGTLNYMSPEAIQDNCNVSEFDRQGHKKSRFKIGVKSDVWSLGCILYNMVYGRTPFQHIVNQMARIQAITNCDYKIVFPDTQDSLILDVLKKCLERDPKKRASIQELIDHPYLTSKGNAKLSEEVLQHLNIKFKETNVNSPNSFNRFINEVVNQLQSGVPSTT